MREWSRMIGAAGLGGLVALGGGRDRAGCDR